MNDARCPRRRNARNCRAQLCGLGHYRMRGFVTIQEPAEFQTWMDEQVAAAATSAEDDFFN